MLEVNGCVLDSGRPGAYCSVTREWRNDDSIVLTLPMRVKTSSWFSNSAGIERGPLVFALQIGEDWKQLRGLEPFADWEVYPTSPWNFALLLDSENPWKSFSVHVKQVPFQPFDSLDSPIVLKGKGRQLKEWGLEDNSAGTLPISPLSSDEPIEDLSLIPYGAAKLRIAEFPWIESPAQ
jgi:hypothetical protein